MTGSEFISARFAHNPKNGQSVEVAAKHAPHVKPAKALRSQAA